MVFGLANFQNKKGRIILRHPSCCRWQPAPLAGARRRLRRRRSGPPALVPLAVPVVVGGSRQARAGAASAGPSPAGRGVRGPPPSLSCRPDGSTAGGPPWPRLAPNRRSPAACTAVTAAHTFPALAFPPAAAAVHPCCRRLRCPPSFQPLPATAAAGHSVGAVGGGGVGGRSAASASQWPCYRQRTGPGRAAMVLASESSAASLPGANPHEVLFWIRSSPPRKSAVADPRQ